ncbi:sensor histidine kinase [Rudaeicoccus suwonensis]|uniref:histidine kinase n=1 Tax=Rudaeicoccus suwonensis TaxID=657409 RepID=A0A561E728_9MICO|nr:HAMP domain-containing sensor histidine kinase [Rudaeicoccus suwonensis]TWE11402.1 two-component system OmpR family sensor kinase [Rudaeicoccus suwonensis]
MSALLHPSRWTLRTKLVAWVLLLFLAVSLAVGGLTVVELNRVLLRQTDGQLLASATGMQAQRGGPGNAAARGFGGGGLGAGGDYLRVDLTGPSTVLYDQFEGSPSPMAYAIEGGRGHVLSASIVEQINTAGIGRTPRSVDLGGSLGEYRLIALQPAYATSPTGQPQQENLATGAFSALPSTTPVVTVIGVPLGTNNKTIQQTAIAIALLSGAGVVLVGTLAAYIIRRNLEPLRRVAATATRVSKLPLSAGEVEMTERVQPRDTDEGTEVGQVGAALNGMLDHIDKALTARQASEMQVRQFVADASHELRTPLASIRGYAELSRREREPIPEGVVHSLGRIESEAIRITALVEDLLLLARLDSGRPLERKPVEVTSLVIETVSDAHAAGRDHSWDLDLPDEALEVEGDEARIRQVLINLLANARRHTPEGTVVTTSVRREGAGVLFLVRDNGPGIPPELVPHIFERFTRGDSARTRTEGSTGLGLSIVHAVVTAHHGTVRVTSQPGDTVFAIWLPDRQLAESAEIPENAADVSGAHSTGPDQSAGKVSV